MDSQISVLYLLGNKIIFQDLQLTKIIYKTQ